MILKAGGIVEMENTNFLGGGKHYHKFTPPNGGYMYFSRSTGSITPTTIATYSLSIAKLKEHVTAGVTMSMKNLFGITSLHDLRRWGAARRNRLLFPKDGEDR